MQLALLQELNAARTARQPVVVLTDLDGSGQRLLRGESIGESALATALADRLRSNRSGMEREGDRDVFVQVFPPPVRLVMVGAVHIAQALAKVAALMGFDISIVDPRTAFATSERFPEVEVIAEWPQDVLPRLRLDPFTAVALLSHDPKIDDPALTAALRAGCFYVGALGSRKTHARRLDRMREAGFTADALDKIYAPIGLDIGAVSPEEIAIAIAGELIAAQRKKPTRDNPSQTREAGRAA